MIFKRFKSTFLKEFMTQKGPVYSQIESKLTLALNPTFLDIIDDSSKHAKHSAMRGVDAIETHFRVTVVSDEFKGKPLVQRHRLIYSILGDELKQGLHALSLTTKTKEEYEI
ncbi:hypothetical protein HK103_003034 [Boothiomyces macroporosus]|uniref:BolA-like protein n=1 Tax=Boothiomyces macroporosus TaxID=261099 RepID=A0AAD5Y2D9_9FUNG|nr:hypothetical protein HK103_003034 [Boothiomyces macroporosus]